MTKTITVDGTEYDIPSAEETGIVAGYVLDEASAKHLYQTRNERIRNNITPVIKRLKEQQTDPQEIADYVHDYAKNYKFSLLGRGAKDDKQLENEQYAIARDYIQQYLAEQGRTSKDIPEGLSSDEWEAKLRENIDRVAQNPDTIKLARKRIAERRKTGASLLSDVAL
jgi:hypothetical protein